MTSYRRLSGLCSWGTLCPKTRLRYGMTYLPSTWASGLSIRDSRRVIAHFLATLAFLTGMLAPAVRDCPHHDLLPGNAAAGVAEHHSSGHDPHPTSGAGGGHGELCSCVGACTMGAGPKGTPVSRIRWQAPTRILRVASLRLPVDPPKTQSFQYLPIARGPPTPS